MKHYIGIDVSKSRLDVDWLGKPKAYDNEKTPINRLIRALSKLNEKGELELVICEATGGYEQNVVRTCRNYNIPVHVAHANKVRYFAKSKGLLAKTDHIDAKVLSEYGRLFKPKADLLLLSENTEKIAEILKRREQLLEDKKREQNRLDKNLSKKFINSLKEHIDWLDKEIKELEQNLAKLKDSGDIKTNHSLLISIPCIGDLLANYILAYLPEIGTVSNKVLAALVGVAPFNNDSGKNQGKRFIKGGRSKLRQALYMAAIAGIRCNQTLKAFYVRLKNNGKPAKVALIAVIRKLLSMVNSVIKRQTKWVIEYAKI